MKQKKYTKLLTVIPLACMLSTPVIFLPITTFAAGTESTVQLSPKSLATNSSVEFSKKEFEDWITNTVKSSYEKTNPNIAIKYIDPITYEHDYVTAEGPIELNVKSDGSGKVQSVSLGTHHNTTDTTQQFYTESKAVSETNTFTETNSEGVNVGFAEETKLNVGIPLIAEGGITLKFSIDSSYTHTTADTRSRTETVTFPSQPITSAPHGTTNLVVLIKEEKYSGNFTGYSKVTAPIMGELTKIEPRPNPMSLYSFIKGSGVELPPYVKLDDDSREVFIKTTTNFNGVAGYHSIGETTFTPDDPKQQPIKRSIPLQSTKLNEAK